MKIKKYAPIYTSILTCLLFIAGCSAVKKMDSMERNTGDMRATTAQMRLDTEQLRIEMASLLNTTQAVYLAGLQKGATQERRENLVQMQNEPNIERKISYAAHYFASFEYNFWHLRSNDDHHLLDGFLESAMTEFFYFLGSYVNAHTSDLSTIELTPTLAMGLPDPNSHPDWDNVKALALALHTSNYIHTEFEEQVETPYSMWSLLRQGLNYRKDLNANRIEVRNLPAYARVILENEPLAVYLLQVRHNMLAGYALNQVPGFTSMDKILKFTFSNTIISDEHNRWNPNLEGLANAAKLEKMIRALNGSMEVRGYLRSIEVAPIYDVRLHRILRNMQSYDLNQATLPAEARTRLPEESRRHFFTAVHEIATQALGPDSISPRD